ncbi:MAG TPA: hypothetical protein DEA78_12100 [Cyanobacteria bacterium UBA11159]|nr:hypothetical protein [Cyanobacteria bacterium UBA11367]HBE60211.1 hypothetical protein [Cyanobacteria bacterium UBA11366]HBR74427.1 hypothetical protein [Cyanobacteria bacterium UBA11159]HBS68731.1 hypothetical protein [Cyanobacteria bacterium UBA11153]HCA97508.1 hypothetical protein [Cyanobacteria bacterium UBA9226]
MLKVSKILAALSLSLLLIFTTACAAPPKTPPASTTTPPTTSVTPNKNTSTTVTTGKAVAGGAFNKFFPANSGNYKSIFAQEKTGFAQAKLQEGGKDVATLSISDLASNPTAAKKYQSSTKTVAGYPAVEVGKTQSAILVGNRYQVTVQSTTLTPSDRESWLQKFNLSGLAQLK